MHNRCVPIALNITLLIGLDFWNNFYDTYNNLHFHQILHHSKPVSGTERLKLDKTYSPKG